MFLSISFLIALVSFFYINRFPISLFAVQFSSFFSLKRFLISLLIFSSSGLGFSILYDMKKLI